MADSNALAFSFHVSGGKHAVATKSVLRRICNHIMMKYRINELESKIVEPIYSYNGIDDIYSAVAQIYDDEFSESVIEYNKRQKRPERRIANYMDSVSENQKNDVAVETIIQIGSADFWKQFAPEEQVKISRDIYKKLVKELQKSCPDFRIANATVHAGEPTYDEHGNIMYYGSPHVHIIGVPIADNCKTGMKKQAIKTRVFTRDSLRKLQEHLHDYADNLLSSAWGSGFTIKPKKRGRNQSLTVDDYKLIAPFLKSVVAENEQLKTDLQSAIAERDTHKNAYESLLQKYDKLVDDYDDLKSKQSDAKEIKKRDEYTEKNNALLNQMNQNLRDMGFTGRDDELLK